MVKGISGITIAGLFIVLVIFTVGLYPSMQTAMSSAEASGNMDPFSVQMMKLVPMGFFIAILVGILFYAFSGKNQQGGIQQ